ncbi:hypothetical protein Nps_00530 [Candidatus Nanopusillus acidilobi]|nr:hypothetical protein Nps_00530 [Candidatus Nanopusillus acidilobi]
MKLVIKARGNKLIKATHKSTLEITKDNFLTERGDCIIGINANYSVKDLPEDLKYHLLNEGKIKIVIKVDDLIDDIIAYGSKNLLLTNDRSIVIRKSNYIDDRTLAINSNKSAIDIDRKLIEELRKEKDMEFVIYY